MTAHNFETSVLNTWCPGCGNFPLLNTVKTVLQELGEGESPTRPENLVLVAGIGCHGKIVDYLNLNSFYSIHGRVLPVATGIKLANPDLEVIGFAGDGDAYGEGLEHLIYAAKRNIDITVIIHNNRVYSLTTGQFSPTSPLGFPGRSTPAGSPEPPLNPLELLLAGGATFLARGFSSEPEQMKQIFREAIDHRGFALVDILQVCVTFNNLHKYYAERVYTVTDHDPADYLQALNKIKEWDYGAGTGGAGSGEEKERIPLGILYKREAPTFDRRLSPGGGRSRAATQEHREALIEKILANSK
ncbi:MAG: 2-oxoacid:ferredoxin oxidoreductase subunit beta [Firmicutes bacterium]|nr:2-oxoacid:ferredoxin oxidoreductase subunit beta [Bacillota bacterium]